MQRHDKNIGSWPTLLAFVAVFVFGGVAFVAEGEPTSWSWVSTDHFEILTDAEVPRAAEVALGLERFRAAFALLAPGIELSSPAPTRIFAFRDAESYAPYKNGRDRGGLRILGQFLSHPDGNYITLDTGAREVGSLAVIYHEYVHHFVRHNFPRVPLWFNEGLAEYYSTFAVEEGFAFVGRPVERHLRWLRGRELELEAALTTDRAAARAHAQGSHGADEAGQLYAASWALMHYLLSGPGAGSRLDNTADFLTRVAEGEDPLDALEEAFETRLGRLEEAVREHVFSAELPVAKLGVERLRVSDQVTVSPAAPADVQVELGGLLARLGRTSAAEGHFQAALDLEGQHPEAHAGLALVRDLQNRFEEAELLYQDALRLGSSRALTRLLFGRHLLERMRLASDQPVQAASWAERARKSFAKAVDLDPSFAEARALLGYSHLFGEADPASGLPHLIRAMEQLPERMDVVYHAVQLYLKNGDFRIAEELVEDVLVRWAPPEMVTRAREDVERLSLIHAAEEALAAGEIEEGLGLFDQAVSATSDPALRQRLEEQLLALQQRLGEG